MAETEIITLRGSHATTLTRYRGIEEDGWIPGSGRAGTGVYFWAEGRHFLELASAWYLSRDNRYFKDAEKECIIVVAALRARREEVLNFEDQKLKEALDALRDRKRIGPSDRERIEKLFDAFLSLYQEQRQLVFKIVKIRVDFPKKHLPPSYSLFVLGWPLVYVARDMSIIERERVLNNIHEPFES